nr:hypothetical protein [Tanacetum cinerariifolium]
MVSFKQSHDLPLSEVNTSRSGEDSMEHQHDLTDFVPPTPHDLPLSGGHTPGSDEDLVIKNLQKKVKILEKKQRERTLRMNLFKIGTSRRQSLDKENVSKQGKNLKTRPMFEEGDIDDDFDDIFDMVDEAMETVEGDTVNAGGAVNTATTGVSAASAPVTTAGVSISIAEPRTTLITTTTTFEDEDLTIAQTLVKMRSKKAKEKGVAFRDVKKSARLTTILPTIDPKDKGKVIMQEPKKPPKNPRMAQIQLDEELAKSMHEEEMAEFKKRQKKSRMLVEMIAERKRFFAAQRAAKQRSKPPTKAQMRNRMCIYLKNQAGYKHNQLKGRSYDDIQKLFDKAYKQINLLFLWILKWLKTMERRMIAVASKKKRAYSKLKPKKLKVMKEQESIKDEQEKEEFRLCLKIVQDEDKASNYETLAVKSPIVDWET